MVDCEGESRGSSESAWWKDVNRIAHSGVDDSWLDKAIKRMVSGMWRKG